MAMLEGHILGIDIGQSEINVVEITGDWRDPKVVRVGSAPTPAGAVDSGRVVAPDIVADTLRSIIDLMKPDVREAVFGLSSNACSTRIIDVPPVSEKELRAVIQGELNHFQVAGTDTVQFDFIPLPKLSDRTDETNQVLVMSADAGVVDNYRMISEMTGLRMAALEPNLISLFRTAILDLQKIEAGACLTIGRNESEISIVTNGSLRLYRRIDIGSEQILPEAQHSPSPVRRSTSRSAFSAELDDLFDEVGVSTGLLINPTAASNLTLEVQRSLDYFSTQFPEEPVLSRLVVVSTISEMVTLGAWLGQAIPFEIIISAFGPNRGLDEVAPKITGPNGMKYLCAFGLGMRQISGLPLQLPSFDLSGQRRREEIATKSRRSLGATLIGSIVALAIGAILTITIGIRISTLERTKAVLEADLEAKEKRRQEYLTSIKARRDLLQNLMKEGYPFSYVMDAVNKCVDGDLGLTNVSLGRDGRLVIGGEATQERYILTMVNNLRVVPFLDGVSIDGMDAQAAQDKSTAFYRFQISSTLKRPDQDANRSL